MSRSRLVAVPALLVAAVLGVPAAAAAHVHGITPLRCLSEPQHAGANRVDATAAAAAAGGPIAGLIPRDVGSAPLTVGDGGFDAAACR